MKHDNFSAHTHGSSLSRLVERACRHWEARRQAAAARDMPPRLSHPFTIALSREAGTPGTSVARELGRLLGWQVYDYELLERIAREMGLRTTLLESVDEKRKSWLLETAEAFLSAPLKSEWMAPVSESAYVRHLIETVLALGAHGECVIVGRGSPFILPAETTLRVRLVAPVEDRIVVLSRKLGISEQDAARQVRTTDRERNDFVQEHFLKDPTTPRNYDLVVNASRLSVGQCAELIVETLRYLQAPGPLVS
jgi:cytidylate kinase